MAIRLLFLLLGVLSLFSLSHAQEKQTTPDLELDKDLVFVIPLRSEVDPRSNRMIKLGLDRAKELDADYVIIDMNTYGGAVLDADSIRTRILAFDKPIWVFINDNAASAGALISIACDSIYMAPGSTIGAATVVQGGTGEAAPDKYQSYFRAKMRETARQKGRDPRIAEAMVDQNIEIDSITEAGNVITFTTEEAIKFGYCEAEVSSIEEILKRNKVENYRIQRFELSASEKIIAFFLNPFISGLLMLVIIGGIYFELQTPGVGFPIMASITALVMYLVPYYLNGLAENWEVVLFIVGIILIIVELVAIPGFGVIGFGGIILCFTSLVLIMLDNNFFDFHLVGDKKIRNAFIALGIGFLGSILLVTIGGMSVIKTRFFQRLAVTQEMRKDQGFSSSTDHNDLIGKEGTAYTDLRPGGKIQVENDIYDASTRGEYIEKGQEVVVIKASFSSLIVKLKA